MRGDLGMRGVWVAVATPLDGDGDLDGPALARHAASLLAAGCDGVAPFGTTGEGPSFTAAERQAGLEALLCGGVPPEKIVVGIGATALGDAVTLARHALSVGVSRFLMLPPFYFKDLDDDGLHGAFARVLDRIGDGRSRFLLYHIPQVTQIPVPAAVIERLLVSHSRLVAGIKDSSGNLGHTELLVRRFPDISVFCGAEEHLPALLAIGGAGTICGLANIVPQLMLTLRDRAGTTGVDEPLSHIASLAAAVSDGPFVPRLKALLATLTGEESWRRPRPPLLSLPVAEEARLLATVRATAALRDDWPAFQAADGAIR